MGSRTSSKAENHCYHPPFPPSLEHFALVTFASICTVFRSQPNRAQIQEHCNALACTSKCPATSLTCTWQRSRDVKTLLRGRAELSTSSQGFLAATPLPRSLLLRAWAGGTGTQLTSALNQSRPHWAGISPVLDSAIENHFFLLWVIKASVKQR